MKYNILHLPFKVNIMTSQDYTVEDDVFNKEIKASLLVVCLLHPFRSYQIFTCPYHHNPLIKGSHILPHRKKKHNKNTNSVPFSVLQKKCKLFYVTLYHSTFF